jgi:ABC-type lipoprotein export system ATPase subunit
MSSDMIHLEGVSKTYYTSSGEVHALSGVNLDVAPGEFVAVRGPSGCGKSTLLTIIGGLAAASAGRVRVAGKDLGQLSPAGLALFRRREVGFVFQTFHLLPYLDVLGNVMVAAAAGTPGNGSQRAGELLQRFQLGHRLRHRPAELSTGESQRVAIARALVNRPSLLLADEPTGNLDAETSAGVLELLADFHRQGGTVLLVTHEESAAGRAQRTVLLRQGELVGYASA